MAAWGLLARRGFNPEAGADIAVRRNYEDAVGWLRDVARGHLEPDGLVDASPAELEELPEIRSEPRRQW